MKTSIFIDRDGTMGGDSSMPNPWEYKPYKGTEEAFKKLNKAGIPTFIITNQSCIARGTDNGYDFYKEFKEIGATDAFICCHDDDDNCNCRKPKVGLIQQAHAKYGMSLPDSYVIGDRWSDMVTGGKMGLKLIIVKTGKGEIALNEERHLWKDYEPVLIADNFAQAVDWIILNEQSKL